MVQPRCFDLKAPFMRARVLREDLEDHLGPVEHPRLQGELEVTLLARAQVFIAHDHVERAFLLHLAQCIDLAHPDEVRGVDIASPLHVGADNVRPGGAREVAQLRHLMANDLGSRARQQHAD